MSERMSDKRLAEIAKDAETYIYIPHPQGVCQELITALKADREADRAEVERLEKALASSCDDARKEIYGCCPGNKELALQAKVERLEEDRDDWKELHSVTEYKLNDYIDRTKRLEAILQSIEWVLTDKYNREFTAKITVWQMDKIYIALAEALLDTQKNGDE